MFLAPEDPFESRTRGQEAKKQIRDRELCCWLVSRCLSSLLASALEKRLVPIQTSPRVCLRARACVRAF